MVCQCDSPGSTLSSLLPADQPGRGGGSSLSAALHLQTGDERRRGQSGETLELLRLPGHQEHIRLGLVCPRDRGQAGGCGHMGASASRETRKHKKPRRHQGRHDFFLPTKTRMSHKLFRVFVLVAQTYLKKEIRREKKTAASLWLQESRRQPVPLLRRAFSQLWREDFEWR